MPRLLPGARTLWVFFSDSAVVAGAFALGFLIRFDFDLSDAYLASLFPDLPIVLTFSLACNLLFFYLFNLYRGIFYFSSFSDLLNIIKACSIGGLTAAAATLFMLQGRYPRSLLLLHPILVFLGVCGVRFCIRLGKSLLNMPRAFTDDAKSILLVGAGEMGESLLRQMQRPSTSGYRVIGFLDDDRSKWGMQIHGIPVFGGREALADVLGRFQVDEVVIALSSRRGEVVRSVMETLRSLDAKPKLRIAPSLDELLVASNGAPTPRRLKPADLLNRPVAKLDMGRIANFIKGKVVLVTGAGGTIGSELCRRVLRFHPAKLILLENHATSLFFTDRELRDAHSASPITPILGDVRDQALIDRVFAQFKPNVILHAAAHKHVHQLEENVAEGVSNNILATAYLTAAAERHGSEAFLLVSTDKAVRPTSVMGATKRAAELIVKWRASRSISTRFTAVRFGNVLGSSGSVLEIFQKQIAKGGPVTVTHEAVTRFFMTVEEAVQLILQAAAMARGGEIFVLKMGAPVKIIEMARNLILLSGLEPGKDIDIKVTGLKQGEKLEEELIDDPRDCSNSGHPSIMVLRDDRAESVDSHIADFEILSRTGDSAAIVARLRNFVPTFTPDIAHSKSVAQNYGRGNATEA